MRFWLALVFVFIIGFTGCDEVKPTPPRPAQKAEAPKPKSLSPEDIDRYIDGGGIHLVRSTSRVLSGDIRPSWIAYGRIRNNSDFDIKTLKVRLDVVEKKTFDPLDTADFSVEDIPSHTTKGFRREVQLLIEENQFQFTYNIIEAITNPK